MLEWGEREFWIVKAKTQIKIGLTSAAILITLAVPSFIVLLVGLISGSFPLNEVFIMFLVQTMMVATPTVLYVFALARKKVRIARWMYRIWLFYGICFVVWFVFGGLFTMASSEGLVSAAILLVLMGCLLVSLILLPLKLGIWGVSQIAATENQQSEEELKATEKSKDEPNNK